MSKLVFGRDRLPKAWDDVPRPPECKPGQHLVDYGLDRCTVCGWLDPDVTRCATQGCDFPAVYAVDVLDKTTGKFVSPEVPTCAQHAFQTGVSLIPGPSA